MGRGLKILSVSLVIVMIVVAVVLVVINYSQKPVADALIVTNNVPEISPKAQISTFVSQSGFSVSYPTGWLLNPTYSSLSDTEKANYNNFTISSFDYVCQSNTSCNNRATVNGLKIDVAISRDVHRTFDEWIKTVDQVEKIEDISIGGDNAKLVTRRKPDGTSTFKTIFYMKVDRSVVMESLIFGDFPDSALLDFAQSFRFE